MQIETTTLLEADYAIANTERLLTPSLAVHPKIVDANIETTLHLLNGDPNRWRPHLKTTKLCPIVKRLLRYGVAQFKCATSQELLVACKAGAADVLVAFPVLGPNARRIRQIAMDFPDTRISALVDSTEQISQWRHSQVDLFVDIDPGMHRTGVPQHLADAVIALASSIHGAELRFRGLHYYDGHLCDRNLESRTAEAHQGYEQLLYLNTELHRHGIAVSELVVAGTPTLPCALSYQPFQDSGLLCRVSPGTLVYGDLNTLRMFPAHSGYRPAAVVVTRVVSRPGSRRVTCDAGHKALSVDAGVPNGQVIGHPGHLLCRPSEEHLPIDIPEGEPIPDIGEILYLAPLHVCTTVHNFDYALFVRDGSVESVESMTARGRGLPMLSSKS